MMSGAGDAPDEPGLFDKPEKKKKKGSVPDIGVSNPDDIDIEEPEGKELAIEFGPPTAEGHPEEAEAETNEAESSNSPADDMTWANKPHVHDHHLAIRQSHEEIEREGEILKKRMDEFKSKLEAGQLQDADYQAIADAETEFQRVAARVEELSRHMQNVNDHIDELRSNGKLLERTGSPAIDGSKMSEYVRTTRGLTLRTLAIYLIPIKASVLARAIDLSVLQNITLLNVGPQIPFWNLLARENKLSPLPLRSIHTDNVTPPLLVLISQLDTVTELFFLERTAKARVESTAAKTTVTMDQIRKLVLKKHAASLRILMIRNDAGVEWDLNVKTVMLLCKRAKLLEELACSFGVRIMVSIPHLFLTTMSPIYSKMELMQKISTLSSNSFPAWSPFVPSTQSCSAPMTPVCGSCANSANSQSTTCRTTQT
jgi:predicted nucleic acid-binding protein